MTNDQLVDFLNNTQRDPRLNEILYPYYNMQRGQHIIDTYEKNKDFAKKGILILEYSHTVVAYVNCRSLR